MGIQQGDNGGSDLPPEGDRPSEPEKLPELPPDWGEVPDDPAELAHEAEQIRAELAGERIPDHPTPSGEAGDRGQPSIGTPLLIMSVAVVITLLSLFAMAWSGSGAMTGDRAAPGVGAPDTEFPLVTLADPTGRQVALTTQTPMALLLVEECDCQQLIAATAASAPAGVRVVVVGHSPPPAPTNLGPDDPRPVRLGDPTGLTRTQLELGPPTDTATVLLVDREGQIRQTVPAATSVAQFQGELTNLS